MLSHLNIEQSIRCCFRILVLIGCVVFLGLAQVHAGQWWTQQYDNQNTSYIPDGPEPPLYIDWQFDTGADGGSVVVSNGLAFVGHARKTFYALDESAGTELWQVTDSRNFGTACVQGSTVYVGASLSSPANGKVYAFDAQTGGKFWEYPIASEISSGVKVANGMVYAGYGSYYGGLKGGVMALDALDGNLKWDFPTTMAVFAAVGFSEDSSVLYAVSDRGWLHALDALSGVELWHFETGYYWTHCAPTVKDGIVYFTAGSSSIWAVNGSTGTEVWHRIIPAGGISSCAVSGNILYVGSHNDNLYALDTSNNGAILWTYTANADVFLPIVCGGTVYIGSRDGKLHAVNKQNGVLQGEYQLDEGAYVLSASQGRLFAGTWNGTLYAFVHGQPSPAEQIQEILDFVDESVAEGSLVGIGPGNSAEQKLEAFINMLEEAQSLIDTELFAEAHWQLQDAYGKCDGQSPPPDFVAGEAMSELAELIQTLMESIQGVPGVTESARMFIISVHDDYPLDLHIMLEADPTLRYNYIEAHLTLSQFNVTASDENPERVVLYNFCRDFVSDSLQVAGHLYFEKQRSYDPASTPTVGFIRERFYRTWKDALPLTPERLVEIAQIGNFSPQQAEIFTKFSVLVMDNARLDADQLAVIDTMLSLVPQSIHDLAAIGVVDQIGSFPPEMGWWDFFDGKGGEINIFSTPIGAIVEQHFPDDVAPWLTDSFTIALAHEINHIVDSWTVSGNSELASRRQALIQAAGSDHMNYLRSMLPDGFFVDLPQEFFASIANQWFSNSARTLQLGLNRFDNGLRHPINQALFFAEIYSGGGTQTWFFTTDTTGQITRFPVPIQRDNQGRINGLTVDETVFQFELDAAGDVTNYVEAPISDPVD